MTPRMSLINLAECVEGVLMAAMFVPGSNGFRLTAELYRARRRERFLADALEQAHRQPGYRIWDALTRLVRR